MSNQLHDNSLTAYRTQHGLTQAQAARLVGCNDRNEIAKYEHGAYLPNLTRAAGLASAYRTSVETLFPLLFKVARNQTERRWKMLNRLRPKPYDPTSNHITVLAIYTATRKVGVAVFEVAASAQDTPAPSANQKGAARRRQARRTARPLPA
jgi:transcriptional regulator with XRE-family HTH domain